MRMKVQSLCEESTGSFAPQAEHLCWMRPLRTTRAVSGRWHLGHRTNLSMKRLSRLQRRGPQSAAQPRCPHRSAAPRASPLKVASLVRAVYGRLFRLQDTRAPGTGRSCSLQKQLRPHLLLPAALCAKLRAKELDWKRRRPVEGFGDRHHVRYDRLDAVAASFNLRLESGHLVAIRGVVAASAKELRAFRQRPEGLSGLTCGRCP